VLRQGRRDLELIRMTPDLIYDQLIGMGCVDEPGIQVKVDLAAASKHGIKPG
jgi:hypothetical protein